MSDKKILAIDPNLFSFSNNTTRKKRDKPATDPKIKMKAASKPVNNTSLKKRSIINMMRKHQETQYKQKFDTTSKPTTSNNDVSAFNNDFHNAKEYFKNLQETVTKNAVPKNHTLKQLPSVHSSPQVMHHANFTGMQDVTNNVYTTASSPSTTINTQILPAPKYGCLKNGNLPTYRNMMNQTRKNVPGEIIGGNAMQSNMAMNTNNPNTNSAVGTNRPDTNISPVSPNISTIMRNAIQSNQIQTKLENMNRNKAKPKKMKRKKTIRRTYKIGRSKIMPKVSVLVSNKTIRNNISTKTHIIKQAPIHEIRKYLIKHGFIRVGAITPNDVLRKMYETAMLMCGEIQNHNPDNLLYNFLHDTEK
jgi:hypothetical protein